MVLGISLLGCLAACGNNNDTVIGTWEYEYGGFTYIFKDDRTGSYDFAGTSMEFTYTVEEGKLSFLYTGNAEPLVLDYELDGDTLNVIDSFGSDTIYKRK